jgi:hypothetical protein
MLKRPMSSASAPSFKASPVTIKKPCMNASAFTLVSVEVLNRHTLTAPDNTPIQAAEWLPNTPAKPACINLGNPLNLRLTVQHDSLTPAVPGGLTLGCQISIGGAAAVALPPVNVAGPIAVGAQVQFAVNTPVVNATIDKTTVALTALTLTDTAHTPIHNDAPLVQLDIYTIFSAPLADNVMESTLIDPGAVAAADQVVRLNPFFTVQHVEQACTWARGASLLGSHNAATDIVLKVVANIPAITYAEGQDYYADHDGWNVWDAAAQTADCSQLASFFADVLGVLGVRARDFELKCRYPGDPRTFLRYFGKPAPEDDWPTHGVLLMRYPGDVYHCYDTTFSYPRINCTLDDALQVAPAAAFIPGWRSWCWIKDDGSVSNRMPNGFGQAAMEANYTEAQWRTRMQTIEAPGRFTAADVLHNHPP